MPVPQGTNASVRLYLLLQVKFCASNRVSVSADCTPLPQLPDGTMDWGSYAGETALGTEVTLTCSPGLAVAGTLAKTQTVVCDLNGWNHTAVQSCTGESPNSWCAGERTSVVRERAIF